MSDLPPFMYFASLIASICSGVGGGGRGVEIGGSRVVQGVAAVAEQGPSRGSRGHSSGFPFPFAPPGLSRVARSRVSVSRRGRHRYLEPPKAGFTTLVDLWFARGYGARHRP